MSLISKVLIANRGEIACRILRTARRLGVQTVAVYSEADKNSRHVALADEAHLLGPAPSVQSYLRQDKILEIAKQSGAQAIHPGYGFLSENVEFAQLCQKEDIIFIGPPANAIRDMGIKSTSKIIMSEADVPIIGGYHGEDQSDDRLMAEADNIGFPVMIKAVRGGGGKGMRIAMTRDEFSTQLNSARTEAMKSFGDQVMLLEKYVENPRHVEVQVFGDMHGNYVYLFERDCSVQRRHQKIIEEAPGPGISWTVRKKLGEAAVRAAQAVKYVGAGTVEFIMDKNFNFYFMEMNTRLQVEHPITEMITGTDLVEWQLKAASGKELPLRQEDVKLNGWSFEARIYAEDPKNNFMPGAGHLSRLVTPLAEENVRIETGVRQGDDVSIHYDPMIAKLVVWGPDRESALLKLRSCLAQYNIDGLPTNVDFLMRLSSHPEFTAGNVDTDFIPRHNDELFPTVSISQVDICSAALGLLMQKEEGSKSLDPFDPNGRNSSSRINHVKSRKFVFTSEADEKIEVDCISALGDTFTMEIGGKAHEVTGQVQSKEDDSFQEVSVCIDGVMEQRRILLDGSRVRIFGPEGSTTLEQSPPKFLSDHLGAGSGGYGDAVAPMPGVVEKVLIEPGMHVKVGDPLIVMIAMKMEYIIKAPLDGVVDKVLHNTGDFVAKGTRLVHLEEEENKQE